MLGISMCTPGKSSVLSLDLTGFGLLESGSVSAKNEVHILVKNCADVIFGGLTFWSFGYSLSFGNDDTKTNWFCGWGNFFLHADGSHIGEVYSKFFFQTSFATTAITVVSRKDRTKLMRNYYGVAYCTYLYTQEHKT